MRANGASLLIVNPHPQIHSLFRCLSKPALAALLLASIIATFAAPVAAERRSFDLPSDSAERAIKRLSDQSGAEVVFATGAAAGVRTKPVKGDYSPLEALQLMLAGTPLAARQDPRTGTLLIDQREEPATPPKNEATRAEAAPAPRVATPTSTGASDEAVRLSPFEVSSAKDHGYAAASTLAGSRLNTPLADTPAPISVFTEELLRDLGATTVADATVYSLNATAFDEREIGNVTGNALQNDGLLFSIRGFRTSATRNYFEWGLNADSYNTTRVDFSRGPNSILFGIGSPGGIVNVSTKQAIFNNRYSAALQAGSHETFRGTIDLNQVIVPRKLALRFNALHEDSNGWRETAFKESDRWHVAGTYRPFARTTLRAEYERGDVAQVRPRPWGPIDGFSAWEAAGSPLVATARGARPAGVGQVSGATRLVFDQAAGGGQLLDWRGMGVSSATAPFHAVFDFDRVPKDTAVFGPGNRLSNRYDTYTVKLEQQLGSDIFIEAAFNRQNQDGSGARTLIWDAPLVVDVNQQLPTGAPNPNVGRFYVEDNYAVGDDTSSYEIARLTASYRLDFKKWIQGRAGRLLGTHQLAGLLQEDERRAFSDDYREVNTTPLEQPNNLNAATNYIYRRTYLDFTGAAGSRGAIDPTTVGLNPQPVTTVGGLSGTVTPGMVRVVSSGSQTKVETKLFATQSSFLDDRLIATYGYREDGQRFRNARSNTVRGEVIDVVFDTPLGPEQSGITRSHGAIVKPLGWLRFFYNEADNFRLSGSRYDLFGQQLPNEVGEGRDYGVRLQLFGNRIALNASRYETSGRNRLTFVGTGNIRTQANLVWDVLNPARRVATTLMPGATDNVEAEGYEFELIANPTARWRLMANFSVSEVKVAGVALRDMAYIEENRAFWMENAAVPVPGSVNFTNVAGAVAFMEQIYRNLAASKDGLSQRGNEKYKANLFTNYRFAEATPLKGFSLGGGARYRSGANTGYTTAGAETFARSTTLFDFRAGYETKVLRGRHTLRLALNVRNLFDTDGVRISVADANGAPQRYVLLDPREVLFTTTFEF